MTNNLKKENSLRILIITDLHYHLPNIRAFKQKMPSLNIDFVICCGDLANAPTTPQKDEQQTEELLKELSALHDEVYFIPGNHDIEKLFNKDNQNYGPKICLNFHDSVIGIDNDLVMMGFGGSSDSYDAMRKKIVHKGYPFQNNDDKIYASLKALMKTLKNEKILLVTHMGPCLFSTTDINPTPDTMNGRIDSGSASIKDFLLGIRKRCVVAIHGHSHYSWGMAQFGNVSVVNPGPLKDGRYCLMDLTKNGSSGWEVNGIQFHKLSN